MRSISVASTSLVLAHLCGLYTSATVIPTLADHVLPCHLHKDPTNPTDITRIECPTRSIIQGRALTGVATIPATTTYPAQPSGPPIGPQVDIQSALNFRIVTCATASDQRSDYCEKAAQAFVQAGQILSNLFAINTVINVNVTLRPFSAANGDNVGLLAAAGPQLSIPLVSDDGVTRYYPSALVKQFKLPGAEFTDTDISVLVNTNAAPATQPQLYFVGDPIPAVGSQTSDFLSTVLHEILHGMGFLSYFEYAQLAGVDVYRPQIEDNSQGQAYSFMETIFDRFTAKQTQATQQGNKALFPGSTTQSGTDQSYITNNAVVYDSFKQLGIDAVTKDTLAFQSNNQLLTYLETSLRPFKKGSSGSHIDRARYQNTSDFLMTYDDLTTGTLAQQVSDANGPILNAQQRQDATALASIDLRLALGPSVRSMMQSIGWVLRTSQTPNNAPTSASMALPSASASPVINSDAGQAVATGTSSS